MPKRPGQHATEDASRRAFELLLPNEWVYRQLSHDYGIDGEVEVFQGGESTGVTFKVQLKGSEREDNLVVRLSHEKAAYYTSLTEPILIVLHHIESGRTYARWFQSFSPASDLKSETSIGLRFAGKDELTSAAVRLLEWDVETHRQLRDSRRALPLRLAIDRESQQIAGSPTPAVALAIRDALSGFPDVFSLADPKDETLTGRIHLREDSVLIDCRSLTTATVHYPFPWPGNPDPDLVLHDAMTALGLILNRIGQYDAAARLFAEFAIGSSIAKEEEVIATVASALAQTHRMAEAISILERLTDEAAATRMLVAMSITWTASPNSLTTEERESVVVYLVRQAELAESEGNRAQAAVAHYNLANRLRVLGGRRDAIEHFRRAAELDPTYPDRDYFAGEFAGALFESGEFVMAAEQYRRAIPANSRRYLPLLADALMMGGEYAEASEFFGQAMAEETINRMPAEWLLKARVLERVLKVAGERQTRKIEIARRLADVSAPKLTKKARRKRLASALKADALCPLAWFNLGILELRERHHDDAFVAFVAAGILSRFDLEAFARALVTGLMIDDELVPDVVRAACMINRPGFVHYLVHEFQASSVPFHAALLEFVDAVLVDEAAEKPAIDRAVEFRFINEDGTYETMHVGVE
jgi:tetratricopeptide (TPR) repeat protein